MRAFYTAVTIVGAVTLTIYFSALAALAAMITVHLDFETYSTADLRKVGAYRYARDPSTEVLIACYAIDKGPVRTWLPCIKPIVPGDLRDAVLSGATFKAHNAEFERQIWQHVLRRLVPHVPPIPTAHWQCTAVRAAAAGLPRSLEMALVALRHQIRKDPRGKRLVRLFCMPRKPTKKDPSTRIMPRDNPEAFKEFIQYCQQDVRSERGLDSVLPDLLPMEWRNYAYALLVNDRGVPLDMPHIHATAKVVKHLEQRNHARVAELTGGLRPTQRDKMMAWLRSQGVALPDMKLKVLEERLTNDELPEDVRELFGYDLPPNAREVLELRLEASKASTKKIAAMIAVACDDGRARGTLLPYGAHTGRFAGKLIQPHNFTRGLLEPEQQIHVLNHFASGDIELIDMLYEKPMHMLAQSMRGFIKAPKGQRFIIADYSMIETRILAWLANEVKLLSIYNRNLTLPKEQQVDVYKLMATVLYRVAYAQVSKEQRRIGKNLRLGAGYQLGKDGLLKNCAKEGIPMEPDFAADAIRAYRDDNQNIVQLWYSCEEAAIAAVQGRPVEVNDKLRFEKWRDWLLVVLPSGRRLHYYDPKVSTVVKFKKPKLAVSYFAGKSRGPKTPGVTADGRTYSYGGKWVENAVQAIAYDNMIYGMRAAETKGYEAVLTVHDENIALRKNGEGNVAEFEKLICALPSWAKGLPLVAEGFESVRYRKG
jgi:DNA polymerase